jgi:hypothetical protein
MDKNVLLLCILLFFLSSQLLVITWDIGKASIYIIVILLILNTINPTIAEMIRTFFKRMLNLDTTLITDGVAHSSSFLLDILGSKNNPILSEIFGAIKPKSEVKSEGTSLNPNAITPNPKAITSNITVPTGSLQNQKSTPSTPIDSFIDVNNGLNKSDNINNLNIADDILNNSVNIGKVLIDLPDTL